MELNIAKREISIKLVYYGPALSGKTTNLQAIHYYLQQSATSDLLTLDTQNDRTLFFDLLPLEYISPTGFKVKYKVFTVPGQVIHSSTRRIVLKDSDGVVFVADSQKKLRKENNQSFRDLLQNLKYHRLDDIPIVIQFNKRDLDNILSRDEVISFAKKVKLPVTTSIAINGKGVLETFSKIISESFQYLDETYDLETKFKIYQQDLLQEMFSNIYNG